MKKANNDFFMETAYGKLFDVLKDILQLFSDYCVETADDGTISKIHGHVLYQRELEKLNEESFSETEIAEYREHFNAYMEDLNQIENEAYAYVKEGKLVPVYYLFRMFPMSAFEKLVFLLSFATSSQSQFKRIFALLQNDFESVYPTVELCAEICTLDPVERMELCKEFTEHISDFEILYKYNIFHDENAQNMLQVPLIISHRIYNFLWDVGSENQLLSNFISIVMPQEPVEPLLVNEELLDGMQRMAASDFERKILYLVGDVGSGKRLLFKHFCKKAGTPLILVDVFKLIQYTKKHSLEDIISEIVLETLLKGNAFIAFVNLPTEEGIFSFMEKVIWQMEKYSDFFGIAMSGETKHIPKSSYENIEIIIDELSIHKRKVLWSYCLYKQKEQLGLSDEDIENYLDVLPARFVLTPGAIKNSVAYIKQQIYISNLEKPDRELVFEACQKQIAHQLDLDATKIRTIHTFDDLILPKAQKKMLVDACNRVKYRNKVFADWGFNNKLAYGKGTSMIFYGPPGTGKTMGAQVLAKELGMELYKVDMAKVLSKYVGESEKKLGEIFEHGKKSQSILFFDEADALFGKRSEVKDSQDKYANASTAFLLQKIEEYEGVIILATNLLQNFDAAFMRRFQFIIEFPFPDEEQRVEIWKSVFPKEMPLDDLDFDFLGEQFKLSGSQIKNIALASAFLVADEGRPISLKDIFCVMKRENSKVGKNMIATDFGKYFHLLSDSEM